MNDDAKRVLLIQPPYGDYTYPYHSLSYVAPALESAGYEIDVIDLNIVWFRSLFRHEVIDAWKEELVEEFESLDRKDTWDLFTQTRAVGLVQAIALCQEIRPEEAIGTFRGERFYDFEAYSRAREHVRSFERLLTWLYPPYDFLSAFAIPTYEPRASWLVEKALACERYIDDATAILRDRFGGKTYAFCGISIPFSAQLVLGLATAAAVGRLFPGTVRVAGGTAISDIYKYRRSDHALEPFRPLTEVLYVGEAETGVVALADWARGTRSTLPPQAISLGEPTHSLTRLPYVSLSASDSPKRGFVPWDWRTQPPDYRWVEWDQYLSPVRHVNYSPSRGCFWNKCTFCDYGLNEDGPTAPSRTMDAETVVGHMESLIDQGIQHVYLAVDAISPRFLREFSQQLIDKGVDLHWSSQFFLTRTFTPEFVRLLSASGLRTASFGLESGVSRVLELMGKGSHRMEEVVRPALDAFRDSKIGLQPLFFFGFPTETDEERQATVDLILQNRDLFCIVTKGGTFAVLMGSEIAQAPDRFGIRNLRRRSGDEIAGSMEYELADGRPAPTAVDLVSFNEQLQSLEIFERPWAGGADTLHTKLYVERHGREVFQNVRDRYRVDSQLRPWHRFSGASRFDLNDAFENVLVQSALTTPCMSLKARTILERDLDGSLEWLHEPIQPEPTPHRYDICFR